MLVSLHWVESLDAAISCVSDRKNVFGNDLVPWYSDICTFYLLYLLKYNIMCRDVIYIFVLHSSWRNYRNTNSDATSHLVTAVKC